MADYIIEPLDTDVETIYADFVEFIQGYYPDWNPSEGQLDVIIARYFAMQTAFTADMASRVQRAIYRYFGASLANIPPLPGGAARGTVNFVIADPLTPPVAHTMPAGTLVGIVDADGDLQMFATMEDMAVAAGASSASVDVQAIDLGAFGNGLTGTVQMVEMIDYIKSAAVVGSTGNGSDPEEDDIYINRLTQNLGLMAPRPVLAQDFAVMAQNIPGVWRAAVIDNFRPGNLEVQRITSNYTGGTFTLSFGGQTTAAIPARATATEIYNALTALSNIDVTDVRTAGGPLATAVIDVTFSGRYGYADQPMMTAATGSLTTGSSFAITQVTAGSAYLTDMANSIAISAVDESGEPLTAATQAELIAYLESTRAQNFVITWVDPAYHRVDIDFAAHSYQNTDTAEVKNAVLTQFNAFLSPALWGTLPFSSSNRDWVPAQTIRYLELTTVLENTSGVAYTDSLIFGLDGGTKDTTNKTFTGAFSLTRPGTITGTVTLIA